MIKSGANHNKQFTFNKPINLGAFPQSEEALRQPTHRLSRSARIR